MTFAKIHDDILGSSILEAALHVRWTWIVCLTLANRSRDGVFRTTVPALARTANITRDEAEDAIRVLTSPDPLSTSPNDDGRRLVEVSPNVWRVVNFEKYRERWSREEIREYERDRKRRQRTKDDDESDETSGTVRDTSGNVTDSSVSVSISNSLSSTGEGESERENPNGIDWTGLADRWNAFAESHDVPTVRGVTENRRRLVRARLREHGPDAIDRLFDELPNLRRWYFGDNDTGWRITFDHAFAPSKFGPIVEGAHRRRDRSKRSGSGDEFADALAAQWDDG